MINIAMLGTGRIADVSLAPALGSAEGACLWSCLSRSEERAREFATKHGAKSPTPGYTSLDDLLSDADLDAVLIATPDGLHAAQAMAAARAGKHVLVEKPMATTVSDAEAMVAACEAAHVRLGVAYHLRWHAGHRRAFEMVATGAIGDLRHLRAQWTWLAKDDSNWRAHDAVGHWWSLAGVGTHILDLIRWFAVPHCGEITRIRGAISRSVWHGAHDETAVATMQFASGTTAELCSSVQFQAPRRFEVYGSEGYIICTDTLGGSGAGTIELSDSESMTFPIADPFLGEIEDFVAAIQKGREPEVGGQEGLINVRLLEEIAEDAM